MRCDPHQGGIPAPASLAASVLLFSSHPVLNPSPQLLTAPQAFAWDGKPKTPSQETARVSGLDQRPPEFGV